MVDVTLEELIEQANVAVMQGDWESAVDILSRAVFLDPNHVGVLTALGTALIETKKAEDAVPYFERVATFLPDEFVVHNNLGLAYTLSGDYTRAEASLRRALEIDSENLATWKNLAQVCLQQPDKLEEGVRIVATLVKAYPEDAGALLMMANIHEDVRNWEDAQTYFSQVLKLDENSQEAQDGLKRVHREMARDPRFADPGAPDSPANRMRALVNEPALPVIRQVYAYLDASAYTTLRVKAIARQMGWSEGQVVLKHEFNPADLAKTDLCIFLQPLLSGDILRGVNACLEAKVPYGVDIEQNYFEMLADHPAYERLGPGNKPGIRAMEMILTAAKWVSVASKDLAERVAPINRQVHTVLPVWDSTNPLWARPVPARTAFHVGWIGTEAERADLLTIKMDLTRFMRVNPRAVLVIAGDGGAYEALGNLSEQRRIFLPDIGANEIPYVFSQFDVLLVPWRDTPYNRSKSDLPLVEAGVRAIPWVASPLPSYTDWGEGGLLAGKPGEWYQALTRLMNEPDACQTLGAAGSKKAAERAI